MNPALTIPAFGPVLPEIILAAGVLVLVLFGAFRGERSGDGMNIIALGASRRRLRGGADAAVASGSRPWPAPSWSMASPSS